ncbi:MAG TPA: single-stranded DNA-binding protein [Solirubrobacteraceae bacterium]|nr:single-stranded DNA-binding protein [Solirubrobacteraceae bacterium]
MSYSDTNRVILVGRLTRDPELRALASGQSVCSLRLANNGLRREGDAYEERPNYFDISVFGAQGENVDRYLRKGSRVVVDGRLEWSEWETSDGSSEIGQQKRQAVNVVAFAVQFLDTPAGAQRHAGVMPGEGEGEGDGEPAGVGAGGGEDIGF